MNTPHLHSRKIVSTEHVEGIAEPLENSLSRNFSGMDLLILNKLDHSDQIGQLQNVRRGQPESTE